MMPALRAVGMGALGEPTTATWGVWSPPTIDTNFPEQQQQRWWEVLIPAAGAAVSNIFSPWQATAANAAGPQQPIVYTAPLGGGGAAIALFLLSGAGGSKR